MEKGRSISKRLGYAVPCDWMEVGQGIPFGKLQRNTVSLLLDAIIQMNEKCGVHFQHTFKVQLTEH